MLNYFDSRKSQILNRNNQELEYNFILNTQARLKMIKSTWKLSRVGWRIYNLQC